MKATFLFVFLFLLAFSFKIKASDQSIITSEVLPDAISTDSGKEYIELYNNTSADINVKDWYFVNTSQSGTNKKIILSDVTIPKNTFFVIAEDLSALNIANGISVGAGKIALYNDFSKLQLFNSSNILVYEINYGDSKEGSTWSIDGPLCNNLSISASNTPGGFNSNYKSECFIASVPVSYVIEDIRINKIEFSLDNNLWFDTISNYTNVPIYFRYVLNKDVQIESTIWKDINGTVLQSPYTFISPYKDVINVELTYQSQVYKGSSIKIDLHSAISNKLVISELYPSPESPDKEWIELYNIDNQEINLSNYYIEEKSSSGITNNRYQLKDLIIKPNNYLVLYEEDFNVSLNNSGDSIYLLDIYGNKIDSFEYLEVGKSQSVAKNFNEGLSSVETYKTLTPTPLSENKFPSDINLLESVVVSSSIKDFMNLKSGTEFTTNVYVNNYIDKYIFIYDGDFKIKAKLTKNIDEDLINTYVQLKAKVTTINGVKTLLINPDDIVILDYATAEYPSLSGLDQNFIGGQFSIKGVVTEVYSNRYRIDSNNQILSIYSTNTSGIKKGDKVTVFGTLDYYRNNFRIIEIDRQVPEVLSEQTTSPVSYTNSGNHLIPINNDSKNFAESSLATFGYVSITFILMAELIKNRKQITKSFIQTTKKIKPIQNKAMIK